MNGEKNEKGKVRGFPQDRAIRHPKQVAALREKERATREREAMEAIADLGELPKQAAWILQKTERFEVGDAGIRAHLNLPITTIAGMLRLLTDADLAGDPAGSRAVARAFLEKKQSLEAQ